MPVPPRAALGRDDQLDRLPASVDVLIIGGGITGVGVALDAASRDATVALVERDDLASGTSSRSSRLVHGGARYLATGDVAMVAEGVRERDRLRRMAPHLVLPLPFVIPSDSVADLALLRAGMTIYDALAAGRGVATHRRLDAAEVLAAAPGLATGFRRGGVRYWDCRTDDARLTLEVARAAAAEGAVLATHTEVTELRRAGGRVVGAELRDRIDGSVRSIAARWTVSASGVWAGDVRRLEDPHDLDLEVLPARGVHLVFARSELPVNSAIVLPSVSGDDRRLFAIPWGEQVYVGTTDDLHDVDLDHPSVVPTDAAYVLAATNAAFGTALTAEDAVGAWAGLRPLLAATGGAATADLSRRHTIVEGPDGLVTITGGKLTTFRRMAADVVDRLAAREGWPARSTTARTMLGSSGPVGEGRAHLRAAASRDPRTRAVPRVWLDGLHHRHGDRAAEVLAACADRGELEPLVSGLPYLRGEVRWAARHELVGRLDDLLQRRLRVSTRHRAAGGAEPIGWAADVLADELGWAPERREQEVARYLDAVRHERGPVPLTT
ncbi:MAG: glycerol-3-phosphate dehydrogenase/oxidase [Nitriliruptor sp.]